MEDRETSDHTPVGGPYVKTQKTHKNSPLSNRLQTAHLIVASFSCERSKILCPNPELLTVQVMRQQNTLIEMHHNQKVKRLTEFFRVPQVKHDSRYMSDMFTERWRDNARSQGDEATAHLLKRRIPGCPNLYGLYLPCFGKRKIR